MKDTLNELRTKYWVPQGRSRVRSVIYSCVLCRTLGCKTFEKVHASPLPDFRVSMSYLFSNSGMDYLGPLHVYPSPGNNINTRYKGHIVLFTWASTRAVHLYLVTDAGSNAFIECFKRFISHRGVPNMVISDNAKCFIGPEVNNFLRDNNCEWKICIGKIPMVGRVLGETRTNCQKNSGKIHPVL